MVAMKGSIVVAETVGKKGVKKVDV